MNTFDDIYAKFLLDFGKGRKMVLSTSESNRVSSRMMSIVQIDGTFYFQTDLTFKKYHQILSNPNVALCIDNIQIEGICEEIGHPLECVPFCDVFQEYKPRVTREIEFLGEIKHDISRRKIYIRRKKDCAP